MFPAMAFAFSAFLLTATLFLMAMAVICLIVRNHFMIISHRFHLQIHKWLQK